MMTWRHGGLRLAAALALTTACGSSARAQGTARSMDIDTSIRAAGMGAASAAVGWGEPGVWGNPASLAGVRGLWWIEGRTQLVPELAPDVHFESQRLLLGGEGVGVSLMGQPFGGVGRTWLDYGSSEGTDPSGNSTGTFRSYEQIRGFGLGLSPLRVIEAIRGAGRDGDPRLSDRVDVAFGFQRKHTIVALAPAAALGVAESNCLDWGFAARASLSPSAAPGAPFTLDASGAFAVLNANDARFAFRSEDQAAPASRIRRMGVALHATIPSHRGAPSAAGSLEWWLAATPHMLELGAALDAEHITAGGAGEGFDVTRFGFEATALGVFSARIGHVSDRLGRIEGNTHGFGARLPIGAWASVGYDFAGIPQATGFPRVTRRGWSAWLDPVKIGTDLGARRRGRTTGS